MIRNLTPHQVHILDSDFVVTRTFEPENLPLRVSTEIKSVDNIEGIEIVKTSFGKCETLPEYEEGDFLIVSRMVIDAHPERTDLLCPGTIVRQDEQGNVSSDPRARGNILGCLNLSK